MHALSVFLSFLLAASAAAAPLQLRVATYNASLNRSSLGQLAADLAGTTNAQAKQVAEIIQRVRPDIVLINEFDYDAGNPTSSTSALERFHNNYLAVSQNGQAVLSYPYRYIAPTNTGVATGKTLATEGDFDNDGSVTTTPGSNANAYGNDCFGFGEFPGKYSFAVYSKYPIQTAALRSFRLFKWKDMPGAVIPPGWYTTAELSIFRLSSKNHVDLPIELKPGHILHLLTSHPTPPSFDGGEDRNGRRNYDEIRLWADYLRNASYLRDDANVAGGLGTDQRFIILGDMNADPLDGDSFTNAGVRAINQLRNHPLINSTPNPSSAGGTQQAALQGGINGSHQGNPAYDTSDFSDFAVGNLRVDHVLPSKLGFSVTGQGVFWPLNTDPTFSLISASDHRLVYLDLVALPILSKAVRNLVATKQGSDVVLSWGTQAGITYKVQTSPTLTTWTDAPGIGLVFDVGAQTATGTDVGAVGDVQKFYRVVCTLEGP
jgi:hypothetical protein